MRHDIQRAAGVAPAPRRAVGGATWSLRSTSGLADFLFGLRCESAVARPRDVSLPPSIESALQIFRYLHWAAMIQPT